MMLTEEKLVELVKDGDKSAFARLYDNYIDKVYQYVYLKTYHKETSEDLTSQIFLKCLEKIASYNQNKGKFSTWLFQITRNTIIDYYRQKKSMTNIEDIWDIPDQVDLEIDTEHKQLIDQVKTYLRELPPQKRDIIIMRLWQKMSYEEIADIIGKSKDNCKMIFSRSISLLREKMSVITPLLLYCLTIKKEI